MSRSLKHRTRQLLMASPLTPREIADALHISVQWVYLFQQDRIRAPGVDTIQRLYELLADRPLFDDED